MGDIGNISFKVKVDNNQKCAKRLLRQMPCDEEILGHGVRNNP